MLVRDIMTKDVITVTPETHLIEVRRLVDEKKLKRIPVVDSKGKLVGIVTNGMVSKIDASYVGAKNFYDYAYTIGDLYRTPVKNVMIKAVITVKPNATVEEAIALAQQKRVGGLIVVDENNKVVGIVTTNDFFYRIVNPVLGIGMPGYRIWIEDGGELKAMQEILALVNEKCMKLQTLHVIVPPEHEKKDLVIHVDCEKPEELIEALKKKGYEADMRRR